MSLDDRVLGALIEANIPWRIIGRRRKLKKEMKQHLDLIYQASLRWQGTEYQNSNIDLVVLENRIEMLKGNYWNVSDYETKLKELTEE